MCIDVEKEVAKLRRQLKKAVARRDMWKFRYLDKISALYTDSIYIHADGSFGTRATPLIEQIDIQFDFSLATAIYGRCDILRKVNEFGMYRSIQQSTFRCLRGLEEKFLLARDRVNDITNKLDFYAEFQPSLY